jgi:hypothetical protein
MKTDIATANCAGCCLVSNRIETKAPPGFTPRAALAFLCPMASRGNNKGSSEMTNITENGSLKQGATYCDAADADSAAGASYVASHTKRIRSTKAEVEARRHQLLKIIAEGRPMTVRQVFYQATVRGIVEKAETGYTKVQTDLTIMRRDGSLPYGWLADNTRWQRKPRTFDSVEEALSNTARFYRKSLWADADAYVEVWLEKDALAGVIYPITSMYDVPLTVARGLRKPIVPAQRRRGYR